MVLCVAATRCNHLTVNHSINFVDPITVAHTQSIKRSWKLAKERSERHNVTRRAMLDSYLCEWITRQRRRQC